MKVIKPVLQNVRLEPMQLGVIYVRIIALILTKIDTKRTAPS